PEDLLITDSAGGRADRVLGLAGVMGGASTEVSAGTTDVLVEAAHFSPVSVARTARRHKLASEAAKRFERGVDPRLPAVAAQRVVDLLVEHGGGRADAAVSDLDT
ncbi:phenylalanine--tRNA ligase beta subunit-related protein, partial [Georgenia sp. 10Sc9-8]|nr:phenylalanine--tRNA ligase beta subunit-related protein [Georgenia halotolerans]